MINPHEHTQSKLILAGKIVEGWRTKRRCYQSRVERREGPQHCPRPRGGGMLFYIILSFTL